MARNVDRLPIKNQAPWRLGVTLQIQLVGMRRESNQQLAE
jgi:hypothetical protein